MRSRSSNRKHWTLGDRFGWWIVGFGMLIASWLVQICIIFVPFKRKR